jgi:putative membrane-bound dehydrogenase-like protein
MNLFCLLCVLSGEFSAPPMDIPKASDDRLIMELVAREPEVVTPTGIAVDERGRIWVIENQTHHRPNDYRGPAGDRIRIYDDFGADGRARRVQTFAEGFRDGMGLALSRDGTVYFATRAEIMVLRDEDHDDVADRQDVIVKLSTAGDYPHNGLSGFAFDAFDNVFFGMGENLGAPYKLIGSDGVTLTGGGEGGNIYRCRPDGSRLSRVATGFWNPFHLAFDAFGRLFAVDNDPDSRPPCRLLHIVQGGDYGYRYRNGRKGLHPFTSWNGELPGTLPMVAGTGEAPSGIVAYESDGLPPSTPAI